MCFFGREMARYEAVLCTRNLIMWGEFSRSCLDSLDERLIDQLKEDDLHG